MCIPFWLTHVSIHAPARGATGPLILGILLTRVSIHAPARGATCAHLRTSGLWGVSIHAPARGATKLQEGLFHFLSSFNPRARTGRDDSSTCSNFRSGGFNPRARTGRDCPSHPRRLSCAVSIHAPARGATMARAEVVVGDDAFQSTRPHGARLLLDAVILWSTRFQSTRPHGARPCVLRLLFSPDAVSIHAPARGATTPMIPGPGRAGVSIHAPARGATEPVSAAQDLAEVSIHAPARGATICRAASWSGSPSFNPRARTGRDRRAHAAVHHCSSFNPRARTGRDSTDRRGASRGNLFQSTRPHGARRLAALGACANAGVSIHAPARGATRPPAGGLPPRAGFNPRARTGRDAIAVQQLLLFLVSIHAPARGATLSPNNLYLLRTVSIHAPARGATLS